MKGKDKNSHRTQPLANELEASSHQGELIIRRLPKTAHVKDRYRGACNKSAAQLSHGLKPLKGQPGPVTNKRKQELALAYILSEQPELRDGLPVGMTVPEL